MTGDPGSGATPQPLAFGQVGEWLVWSQIVLSSRGRLHVYLPMRDMGVDAMVRDSAANRQVPVQVKVHRPPTRRNVVTSWMGDNEVARDEILAVVCVVDPVAVAIGDPVYVIPAAEIRRLCPYASGVRPAYELEIPLGSNHSRWSPYMVGRDELATALCPELEALAPGPAPSPMEMRGPHAFHAEMRLVTALARSPDLNIFHASPDLEFVEYLVRHVRTGEVAGVQVKKAWVGRSERSWQVIIRNHAYALPPASWVVVFAPASWPAEERRVLLIPSEVLRDNVPVGPAGFAFRYDPLKGVPQWVTPWVLEDEQDLARAFEAALGGGVQPNPLP